jgi:hypothetical protein
MIATRPLTELERTLAAGMFGDAINYDRVTVNRRPWWPLQPRSITMAPDGHLWFHRDAPHYRDCFGCGELGSQAHFIHEMTHVWQAQQRGRWWLPLMRHPFCHYGYRLVPGKPLAAYGIEQQAEIIRHAFLAARGAGPARDAAKQYDELLASITILS